MGGINYKKRLTLLAAAAAAAIPSLVSFGQVSGTWTNLYNSGTWTTPTNWNSNPFFPSAGGTAVFPANSWNVTTINLGNASIALSRIVMDGPAGWNLAAAGTLTFAGPAIIDVNSEDGSGVIGSPFNTHSVSRLTTPNGVVKNGPGSLVVYGFPGGGITVNGGTLVVGANTLISPSAGSITLNGGALRVTDNIGLSVLGYFIDTNGGTISAASTINLNSDISGSGTLNLLGKSMDVNASMTFAGPSNVSTALRILGLGQMTSVTSLDISDTLTLSSTQGAIADRVNNNATLTLRGGSLVTVGDSLSPVNETVGTINLASGMNAITPDQYLQIFTSGLTRANHTALNIGSASSAIHITGPTKPLLSGIGTFHTVDAPMLPWAHFEGATGILPVTVDQTGAIRPLASDEFIYALPVTVTPSNLNLTADATITTPASVNSLTLSPANYTISFGGNSTLTVSSGGIYAQSPPGTFSGYKTTISAPVNFGSAEGFIHTPVGSAPSIEFSGGLFGSGGVVIAGGVMLRGNSSYTGRTTVLGTLGIQDPVISGQPGPLGSDTSAVVIEGNTGSTGITFYPSLVATSSMEFGRDLSIHSHKSTGSISLIVSSLSSGSGGHVEITGDIGFSGQLTLQGSNVQMNPGFVVSGDISGSGSLVNPKQVTLNGNNSFTGGVLLSQPGSIQLGSDSALGTGPVWVGTDIASISASKPITLNNPFIVSGNMTFVGSQPITLSGTINLLANQTASIINVFTPTTFTGEVINGVLSKSGPAVLKMTHVRSPKLNAMSGGLQIIPNGTDTGTSRVQSLTIFTTTWVDLTNNDLVWDYRAGDFSAASPSAVLHATLSDKRLRSSYSDGLHFGLGFADNAQLGLTSFSGQEVDPTSLLVKFTYLGDANLDGVVNIRDLAALAANFNTGPGKQWINGDFNLDGKVNAADLGLLAVNWQAGADAPLGGSLGASLAALGLPPTAVPEPISMPLTVFAAVSLSARRRRSRHSCR